MRRSPTSRPARQRGVTLIIVLIALMVLLAGGVSLMRSSDAAVTLAGQLAFRRDLKNQGERGIAAAVALLKTGDLSSVAARQAHLSTANYSATLLASSSDGVPQVLLSDAAWTAANFSGTDISSTVAGVTVRTVIDRMCNATGSATAAQCVLQEVPCGTSSTQSSGKAGGEVLTCSTATYRISVRVDGPRNTQAFFQSLVAL
ncbi:pilus assembly PilX family protein [Ideonella livida]|uniref:Type 4 fimbrial biogenesis protein PilX N-terminal domain-containing protein n=1 Tax=Ideonella livida TaxID=2707176 RepID=A0A7C9TM60_9BURK|nr:hypothetical protein [Ideonella livida]NDY92087.1 hypothetical protein [Ideonella livida]